MAYKLVIGNKNTSSWSLRPWLVMRHAGIAFDEIGVDLRAPDAKAQILRHSPSGKVPALVAGGRVIWDSLAILEYLAESHPRSGLWPRAAATRALARCVSAEMHSGFQALREHCPMDFVLRAPKGRLPKPVAADVRRIVAIWRDCRGKHGSGGPFLLGRFSAADAMYAPVASRFRTYLPDLAPYGDDGAAQAYVETLFSLREMAQWESGAREEVQAARPATQAPVAPASVRTRRR
ncbi:MAG TPA: glutathione S-transferase family protein [Hyphomicrobiaceae bacterium]|jgi:glutathione S-transferase|nr:glutathione S-transferase family protein [Hyphomicrobiaceae bacterium]